MKVLVTAYSGEFDEERREREYVACMEALLSMVPRESVIIVENAGVHRPWHEKFGVQVCRNGNFSMYRNKGCNEIAGILANVPEPFDDEWTVKITGRYIPCSDLLFKTVQEATDEVLAVGALSGAQVWAGAFAVRTKIFFPFLRSCNLAQMERRWISIEDKLTEALMGDMLVLRPLGFKARIGCNEHLDYL